MIHIIIEYLFSIGKKCGQFRRDVNNIYNDWNLKDKKLRAGIIGSIALTQMAMWVRDRHELSVVLNVNESGLKKKLKMGLNFR